MTPRTLAFRLRPGDDLKQGMLAEARAAGLVAPAIVTGVGSLTAVHVRLANQKTGTKRTGHFEIVSLVGLLDNRGHVHLCVADETGATFGGHLLDGNVVFTTAEVVVTEVPGVAFRREPDPATGYDELVIVPRA